MVATKFKSEFTIKQSKGEFYIETGGYRLSSILTDKKALKSCLDRSLAHQKLAEIKRDKKKVVINSSNQLPSTESKSFIVQEYLHTVLCVVENLIDKSHDINEAINLGNDIINGKIKSNIMLPVWVANYNNIKKMAIETLYLRGKI